MVKTKTIGLIAGAGLVLLLFSGGSKQPNQISGGGVPNTSIREGGGFIGSEGQDFPTSTFSIIPIQSEVLQPVEISSAQPLGQSEPSGRVGGRSAFEANKQRILDSPSTIKQGELEGGKTEIFEDILTGEVVVVRKPIIPTQKKEGGFRFRDIFKPIFSPIFSLPIFVR